MTGCPLETGGPAPLGSALDGFRIAAAARTITFKLNQLSLACPVKRAHPPWTVDDKALIP